FGKLGCILLCTNGHQPDAFCTSLSDLWAARRIKCDIPNECRTCPRLHRLQSNLKCTQMRNTVRTSRTFRLLLLKRRICCMHLLHDYRITDIAMPSHTRKIGTCRWIAQNRFRILKVLPFIVKPEYLCM